MRSSHSFGFALLIAALVALLLLGLWLLWMGVSSSPFAMPRGASL